MRVERLSPVHEPAIEELLSERPIVNLFLQSFLDAAPMDQVFWYGALDGDRALGCALVLAGHLACPYAPPPAVAAAIGRHLRGLHAPCMMVGPRATVDALWASWAVGIQPARWLDQRLYVCDATPPLDAPVRLARLNEAPRIAELARQMEVEDLGRDPGADDPAHHLQVVRTRIEQGRTWVLHDERGEIAFVLTSGAHTAAGCQVGGTFVPKALRGRGLATRGTAGVVRRLLRHHRRVTLHVNEANTPAVRCYERVGFVRADPYRLITVEPSTRSG